MSNIIIPTVGVGRNERKVAVVHNDKCKEFEEKIFHSYDPDLTVFWLPSQMRYSIWSKDRKGKAYLVYICVDKETGGFREPNRQDLRFIYKMDLYRKEKGYSLLREVDEHNEKVEARTRRELSNAVEALSKERWRQFAGNPVVSVPIDIRGG